MLFRLSCSKGDSNCEQAVSNLLLELCQFLTDLHQCAPNQLLAWVSKPCLLFLMVYFVICNVNYHWQYVLLSFF